MRADSSETGAGAVDMPVPLLAYGAVAAGGAYYYKCRSDQDSRRSGFAGGRPRASSQSIVQRAVSVTTQAAGAIGEATARVAERLGLESKDDRERERHEIAVLQQLCSEHGLAEGGGRRG